MICAGKWGTPAKDKGTEVINHRNVSKEEIMAFIIRAARHHYCRGQEGFFPALLRKNIVFQTSWTQSFPWEIIDALGRQVECKQHKTVYPKGLDVNTKVYTASKSEALVQDTPKPTESKGKGREEYPIILNKNPWQEIPAGGSKTSKTPAKKLFAQAALKTAPPR